MVAEVGGVVVLAAGIAAAAHAKGIVGYLGNYIAGCRYIDSQE